MADCRQDLEACCVLLNDCLNTDDLDGGVTFYTEHATVMPHGGNPVTGRQAIKDTWMKILPMYQPLIWEKMEYFEQINDVTAYSNDFQKTVDGTGIKGLFCGARLWKKVDDQWQIDRESFNHRPMASCPQDTAKREISDRHRQLYEAFNKDDFDTALTFYTEDATLLPHKVDNLQGKGAMKAVFEKMLPPLKKMEIQEMFYFDLITDTTAYTNSNIASVDDKGTVKMLLRNCLLWQKVGGVWLIKRDMFNARQQPEK